MLIVFSGLPGSGKTTIAQALAMEIGAVYLRIDVIEQALRSIMTGGVGTAGYGVANELALSNLRLGLRVVADCVNPVLESRQAWHTTAERAAVACMDIEVLCSDPHEHRRRVEGRVADITGHQVPDWPAVLAHDYQPWPKVDLRLDTAQVSVAEAVKLIGQRLKDVT